MGFITYTYYYSNNFCYCQVLRNKIGYNLGMVTFKERLKELRTEKGVSQQELGKILNATKMAISHWESGHSEPSISQLIILSSFFDVSIDFLVGKED